MPPLPGGTFLELNAFNRGGKVTPYLFFLAFQLSCLSSLLSSNSSAGNRVRSSGHMSVMRNGGHGYFSAFSLPLSVMCLGGEGAGEAAALVTKA